MTGRRSLRAATVALAIAIGLQIPLPASAEPAPPFTYRNFVIPGQFNAIPGAVNDRGWVAGTSESRYARGVRLFIVKGARPAQFFRLSLRDHPAGGPATVAGMTDNGGVAGTYRDGSGASHGFFRRADGTLVEVNDPYALEADGAGTAVDGVSPDGTVLVGCFASAIQGILGFVDRRGHFATYAVRGAASTVVTFDDGTTFGGYFATAAGTYRGFVVRSGRLTTAGVGLSEFVTSYGSALVGMTRSGELVGNDYYTVVGQPDGPLVTQGFTSSKGRVSSFLGDPQTPSGEAGNTTATAVAPDGVIVGEYAYRFTAKDRPQYRGFVATPTG